MPALPRDWSLNVPFIPGERCRNSLVAPATLANPGGRKPRGLPGLLPGYQLLAQLPSFASGGHFKDGILVAGIKEPLLVAVF